MNKEELTKEIYKTFNKYHNEMSLRMETFRLAHNIEITEELQDDFANAETILLLMEDKDKMYKHLNVFTKKEILTFITLTGCYTIMLGLVSDSIRMQSQIDVTEKRQMLSTIIPLLSLSEEFRNTLLPFMEGDLL